MKKLSHLLLGFVLLISCQEKSINLPLISHVGIQDTIYNNSQLWVFKKEGKAVYNSSNKISTTDWIIHIDRALTMSEVYVILKEIRGKRLGKSMHKNENAQDFLSYMNPKDEGVQLLNISLVNYDPNINQMELEMNRVFETQVDQKWTLIYSGDLSYQQYLDFKANLFENRPDLYQQLTNEKLLY
ncbi:MAG: hypothetical protein ACPGR7_09635 [Flavobacteriaceae bacterium]